MRTRTRTILGGLVLAAALVGGVAWATIPDAAGVINGCYRTSLDDQKGQLRLVDDPASCRSNETAIHWNERGVAGATGAVGATGAPGPQGAQGDNGSDGGIGPQGAKGDTGAAGPVGTNGAPGAKGDPGQAGADGAPGAKGDPGDPGQTGPTGPAGPSGSGSTSTVSQTTLTPSGGFTSTTLATSVYGQLRGSCVVAGTNTRHIEVRLSETATDGSRLTFLNSSVVWLVPPLPSNVLIYGFTSGIPGFNVVKFTLIRSSVSPSGTQLFAEQNVTLSSEILADGNCLVRLATREE